MKEFKKYIEHLAKYEEKKADEGLDKRKKILVNAGINLKWC